MWALVQNNIITKTFDRPTHFIVNETQYPKSVFTEWTTAQQEAIGLFEVVIIKPTLDSRYQKYVQNPISLINGVPTIEYTVISDELEAAKTMWKQRVNRQLYSLLEPTDWVVLRNTETGQAVPTIIANRRAALRAKNAQYFQAINDATTYAELKAALDGIDWEN